MNRIGDDAQGRGLSAYHNVVPQIRSNRTGLELLPYDVLASDECEAILRYMNEAILSAGVALTAEGVSPTAQELSLAQTLPKVSPLSWRIADAAFRSGAPLAWAIRAALRRLDAAVRTDPLFGELDPLPSVLRTHQISPTPELATGALLLALRMMLTQHPDARHWSHSIDEALLSARVGALLLRRIRGAAPNAEPSLLVASCILLPFLRTITPALLLTVIPPDKRIECMTKVTLGESLTTLLESELSVRSSGAAALYAASLALPSEIVETLAQDGIMTRDARPSLVRTASIEAIIDRLKCGDHEPLSPASNCPELACLQISTELPITLRKEVETITRTPRGFGWLR